MTLNIRSITSKSLTVLMIMALTTMSSGLSFVAEVSASECTAPTSTENGSRTPTGADAHTYEYNCGTKLWENPHYTYNPDTQQKTAKEQPTYTYNSSTDQWDYLVWMYSPGQGAFYQATQSVATPPAGTPESRKIGGPTPAAAPQQQQSGSSSTNAGGSSNDTAGAQIANTGSGSSNAINGTTNNGTTLNNSSNLGMNNTINGIALSGNAGVLRNTSGGSATTGDADNAATVINMLQSSSNALGTGSNVKTFTYDIDGDVYGDLFFDPNMLNTVQSANTGPDSRNTINNDTNNDLTVNNSVNASIDNDINLVSRSGDASVSENTEAGDATTGNAKAVANVVNLINSAINSGQSFIGTVNINGNLNGDILLPPDFIDQLIASNVPTVTITGPGSTNTNNTTASDTTTINNTNNLGINNNVNTTAVSGNAGVTQNTIGGNATSGNANTSITAYNLTGSQVVGSNSMLVFVNVMGEWVGLIVNAPAGATAAQLGGGITMNTGPNSTNSTNTNLDNDTNINNTNNLSINNDINVDARSGNATVARNTKGGNARTGDADAAVNLSNIQNATMSFSDWFGILFINVFGSWNGSFGVDTEAGNNRPAGGRGGENSGGNGTNGDAVASPVKVFRFVASNPAPTSASSGGQTNAAVADNSTKTTVDLSNYEEVLNTAATANGSGNVLAAKTAGGSNQASNTSNGIGKTAAIIAALVVLFIVSDAIISRRRTSVK